MQSSDIFLMNTQTRHKNVHNHVLRKVWCTLVATLLCQQTAANKILVLFIYRGYVIVSVYIWCRLQRVSPFVKQRVSASLFGYTSSGRNKNDCFIKIKRKHLIPFVIIADILHIWIVTGTDWHQYWSFYFLRLYLLLVMILSLSSSSALPPSTNSLASHWNFLPTSLYFFAASFSSFSVPVHSILQVFILQFIYSLFFIYSWTYALLP